MPDSSTVSEPGLRERKKRRTRTQIAATAAHLFAERGFEHVSVLDVADAAEVSEQTVYNHFPTKQALVLDRNEELRERLAALIRDRAPGTPPAAAIRAAALDWVTQIAKMDDAALRGGLGYLSIGSPAVRRLALEMTDRHADAIATVIAAEPGGPAPAVAKIRATALAWVFQTITDGCGRGVAQGRTPAQIARGLRPAVQQILDELAAAWPA